ncbi:MAG: nucleotidyl transferase AbiEii/AbiGii toxin family protein [Polyangiaceae bacterium]
MKIAPEQLASLRHVARSLGDLRDDFVFVGGMIRGLLLTDAGASSPRHTDDVDLVVKVASTNEYQTTLRKRLRERGFREDERKNAPICRWILDSVTVDVMPTKGNVLGFSNPWYPQALRTAMTIDLPPDSDGAVAIRVISPPLFCATKLVAFESRGGGDLLHTDLEDFVTLVDGRSELVREMDAEKPDLRKFVGEKVRSLLRRGLDDELASHLEGDSASQARLPYVRTALERIARIPNVLRVGSAVTARSGGDPGATGVPRDGAWTYEILGVQRAIASKPPVSSVHVAVLAKLTSHSRTAGTTGDGRNVFVEDGMGRRFRPLSKLLHKERAARGMPDPYDQILPDVPFQTAWVYELPSDAVRLRLLLPFDNVELPFDGLG